MMWTIDIYVDPSWIRDHYRDEPQAIFPVTLMDSQGSAPEASLRVFGDRQSVRHIQILIPFDSKELVEDYIRRFIKGTLTRTLELFISVLSRGPFHLYQLPGTTLGALSYGEVPPGTENIPLHLEPQFDSQFVFPYAELPIMVESTFPTFYNYASYLQYGIDTSLPTDYRWLNFYKIAETRFNADGKGLSRSVEWQAMCMQFGSEIQPFLSSSSQQPWNFLEGVRASAAHSISRGGDPGYGHPEGGKAGRLLTQTLPVIFKMAIRVINTLPENVGLKFET